MIIVCFSTGLWKGIKKREQQIMDRIRRKGHVVIFVEWAPIFDIE